QVLLAHHGKGRVVVALPGNEEGRDTEAGQRSPGSSPRFWLGETVMGSRNRGHPAMPTQCPDILVLTSSTGAGHDRVAVALREAIQHLAPDVGVRIFDPLSGARSGLP